MDKYSVCAMSAVVALLVAILVVSLINLHRINGPQLVVTGMSAIA